MWPYHAKDLLFFKYYIYNFFIQLSAYFILYSYFFVFVLAGTLNVKVTKYVTIFDI